jgi:arylsulfatase A
VIFTSDNGGLSVHEGPNTPATSNAPLRNGKGYLQEGGIREPLFIKWPGHIRAGSVDETPVCSIDFFPTIMEVAGIKNPAPVDGVSLVPILTGRGTIHREALYWHYPHYANQVRSPGAPAGGGPGAAMRAGRWKLIQHFETGYHELYDLDRDLGETNNLAAEMPDRVLELAAKLHAWQDEVKAQWPTQNPDFKNPPVRPQTNGSILLHARNAVVHGESLRFEPQPNKETLGYWTVQSDWAHWDFEVPRDGQYRLEASQGCGRGSGGAEVEFAVADQNVSMKVRDTGGFQNFVDRDLGVVRLTAGLHKLTVKPRTKPGAAVMDLREVRLTPIP